MRLTIDCTEQQAHYLVDALEEYFRLRMDQNLYLADKLAFDGFEAERDEDGNIDHKSFNRRIDVRNELEYQFKKIGELHKEAKNSFYSTNECLVATDMWGVLRHELYMAGDMNLPHDTRGLRPIQKGNIDMMKVEVKK